LAYSIILHVDLSLPQVVGIPAEGAILTAGTIHRFLAKAVV
jgi:hypothetical protein